MFDFQKLDVYIKAKHFHAEISAFISSRPLNKSISDQLFRASLSVPLNIAEGSGRFSKPDRRNYFGIARSSVFETVAILDILTDSDKILPDEFLGFQSKADVLSRMLFTTFEIHLMVSPITGALTQPTE
ncbi:MAG TPA: four helix bundle protein [Saprospiraceae bacterium]|nr:four helix bundle protein [Saprospiraceae bacterium]